MITGKVVELLEGTELVSAITSRGHTFDQHTRSFIEELRWNTGDDSDISLYYLLERSYQVTSVEILPLGLVACVVLTEDRCAE
jgi:hypothetical protein